MAGHHQWFTVIRLKGTPDPKRGAFLGNLEKNIASASLAGGDAPDHRVFAPTHVFEIAARVLRLTDVPGDLVNFDAPGAVFTRVAV